MSDMRANMDRGRLPWVSFMEDARVDRSMLDCCSSDCADSARSSSKRVADMGSAAATEVAMDCDGWTESSNEMNTQCLELGGSMTALAFACEGAVSVCRPCIGVTVHSLPLAVATSELVIKCATLQPTASSVWPDFSASHTKEASSIHPLSSHWLRSCTQVEDSAAL
jgi:hypothetical protein